MKADGSEVKALAHGPWHPKAPILTAFELDPEMLHHQLSANSGHCRTLKTGHLLPQLVDRR